ncbi:NAD kinase [Serinicoccus hydrothermalis]|uniref:NAD kinase n=1 Tax=Serinicoccus hydrothermalis TaxID=1758689 RepID=A0A1B1N802_9MICO|nr:NAD kinase [Serinicoccus hydrothermalis]ANS77560.1 NAD kinase [Serinicoccus hydrothermalis]
MSRRIMLVTHPTRPDMPELAGVFAERLGRHGIEVETVPEADPTHQVVTDSEVVALKSPVPPHVDAAGCELVVVFGGDGTILRGAEIARPAGTPLLGVNLGRVGFLAEAEKDDIAAIIERIVARDYQVEERMTLEVDVLHDGRVVCHNWALNEASVEKSARERMLELAVEVDGRPLSTWGCDGVVMATPTGSTAYAFSGGGPVVWPDVEALLVVPISAHALFARPVVLSPEAHLAVEVVPHSHVTGVMWCDGRRTVELPPGARIEVRRSDTPVRLARLGVEPFTDRLVAKFALPVSGWRGPASGPPGGRR